jgi:two-component system response regulator YesN
VYKVLLADDEILDLEGMRTFIPWNELGLEVVDAVNNGFAAYDVIKNEHIDILVTDVRMPNMSGLELATKAIEKQGDLRIIFVSGHQDFNYVKQAMKLKAHGYVLKPMDDKELIDSLAKIRQDLDLNKKRWETEEAYKQMVPIVKNEYLLQFLLDVPGEHSSSRLLDKEYHLDSLSWPIRVAVLEIDDYSWNLNPYADGERRLLLNRFYGLLSSLFSEWGIEHVCKISKQRTALLLGENAGLEAIGRLPERIKEEFPFTVTIGLGLTCTCLPALNISYGQAVEALDYKMFHGKGKLITYDEDKAGSRDIQDARNLDVQLDAMMAAVSHYELVQIHDELSGLFQITSRMRSKVTVHNFAMYIIMKLNEFLRTMNEDLFKLLGMELKNLDILLQFETIDDIHSWLRRRVFEISEMLHLKKHTKNGKLIQDIMTSVRDRLHENITLRDVALRFSFSPNYLGHLFRGETGQNFSDYIIALRMERAQELLRNSKLKIYEVANQVGYRYLPYFSRQFKETTGMAPLEYRRKH